MSGAARNLEGTASAEYSGEHTSTIRRSRSGWWARPSASTWSLGGKAPFVVFDDADLEAATRGAVAGSLINAGRDCTAATPAYVRRPLYDAFVDRFAELMSHVVVEAVDDPATDLGSLISSTHRDKVPAMVERARETGAKVVTGGRPGTGALEAGAYYEPTLTYSFDEYTQVKHVMSALSSQPRKAWHDVIFTSPLNDHRASDSRIMTA